MAFQIAATLLRNCTRVVFIAGATLAFAATASAQEGFTGIGGFVGAVGGISIDANGVLASAERDQVHKLHDLRAKALAEVPGDLRQLTELRKISLRGLMATIEECRVEQPSAAG